LELDEEIAILEVQHLQTRAGRVVTVRQQRVLLSRKISIEGLANLRKDWPSAERCIRRSLLLPESRRQGSPQSCRRKDEGTSPQANHRRYRVFNAEAKAYPWEFNLSQWEGKKIEVEGYFRYSRFIVARKRNGKDGFLIFAPFVTAANQTNPTNNPFRKFERTVIVCLGWVPKELKNKIEDNDTPLPLTEFSEETHPGYLLIEDGFNRDLAKEDLYVPLTKLTAYVRPGEERNIFKGYNNWRFDQHYKFIDLFYIARWFRASNIDMASAAYLERVVST
jgi:hypothetical protein